MSECPFEERAELLKALAHPLRLKLGAGTTEVRLPERALHGGKDGAVPVLHFPASGQAEGGRCVRAVLQRERGLL